MSNLKLFEDKKIRSLWDADAETWYFAIVDVVEALTENPNPQVYWRVLKKRLKDEGNETVTNCNALKMEATDSNKQKFTNVKWGVKENTRHGVSQDKICIFHLVNHG